MKKVYTKPEIELIDLTAKELLMDTPDPILDNPFGLDIGGWETDVSLPEGWM
ncbi:MAG: hypothetical protein IJB57_02060 [Clostridia bacterium]|nr:hypothetical protein [Clostridia bacterium]